MKKRNTGHSPNFIHASKIKLPECEATADLIVQMSVEGYLPPHKDAGENKRREAA